MRLGIRWVPRARLRPRSEDQVRRPNVRPLTSRRSNSASRS